MNYNEIDFLVRRSVFFLKHFKHVHIILDLQKQEKCLMFYNFIFICICDITVSHCYIYLMTLIIIFIVTKVEKSFIDYLLFLF